MGTGLMGKGMDMYAPVAVRAAKREVKVISAAVSFIELIWK